MSTGSGQCTALHEPGDKCSGPQSCRSGACAPGTCAASGNVCFGDTDCSGHCSNNANIFCSNDANCGIPGHCSVNTAKNCYAPADCTTEDGTCVFPNHCIHDACAGGGVCAEVQLTADYCTGALAALPVPPN
jgi:hypothetical protein